MSDEPLFCIFCGAEDWDCPCVYWYGPNDPTPQEQTTHGPWAYCETCGGLEPCQPCHERFGRQP